MVKYVKYISFFNYVEFGCNEPQMQGPLLPYSW